MFRKSRGLWWAGLCGWVAAIVFFIMGIVETVRFSRWDPFAKIDWQSLLSSLHPSFGGQFVLHSFLFIVCLGALIFLLGMGARTYDAHPTSTVIGLGFLSIPLVLTALYNVWLAGARGILLLRYQGTQDMAVRQGIQHLFQTGALYTPLLWAMFAYFGFWGFVFLGNAFRGHSEVGLQMTPWCWVSALTLLWSVFTLAFGYAHMFAASSVPRALMIWGDLGLWVLPTITMALGASWLWLQPKAAAQPGMRIEPSQQKIAAA